MYDQFKLNDNSSFGTKRTKYENEGYSPAYEV